MSRLFIAGTGSGCGKTIVTCALLAALRTRGIKPVAFKCGPDYIDPMFHRAVSGIQAYTLDPFFLDGDSLRHHLAQRAGELSVMEGAMGYYDGIAASEEASAYTVARETQTPVILVVSAKGAASSLGAIIEGFARHKPDSHIKGVIFNDAIAARYADLEKIAQNAGIPAYGYMPRNERWILPSRHLGLFAADEIPGLQNILSELGKQALQSLDIEGLIALASTASDLQAAPKTAPACVGRVRIAIARDEAFCFLYQDNLDLLESLGCELAFFSPLRENLPRNIAGVYLCGGYPELHEEALKEAPAAAKIKEAIEKGLPTIAECGGFLYLHYINIINADIKMTNRLQNFGYLTLIAQKDNLLCAKGESIRAHEFHYCVSGNSGVDFLAEKAGRVKSWPCAYATDTLYAGFPHLYFPANPAFADNFVKKAKVYAKNL